jgi:putative ABC transport system permease protein
LIKDYFKLAIKNLRKRKMRSWLTLIGIFVSVAVIFILISLSLGLQGAIQEQFRQLGTDKFFIMPKGQIGAPGSGGAVTMTVDDVKAVEKVTGVKKVSYMVAGNAEVDFDNEKRYLPVIGVDIDGLDLYFESGSMKIKDGRTLEKSDVNKIVIGYDFRYNKVFPKPVETGSKLIINDKEFKVKAMVDKIGNPQDDKNILMKYDDFKVLFNSGDRVDYIVVQINEGDNIKDVAAAVEKKLRTFRGVNEKTQDFSILTPEELLNSFQSILVIITAFLISVAGISLVVGAIGIANTMYTSVLERTKEIGVMKAIGARNSDILLIFVIEAGLIGMVGGILGVALGIGVSKAMEYVAINQLGTNLLRAAIPPYLVIGCIFFAFIIGAVSGILPARHASKIKVVDAIRYE